MVVDALRSGRVVLSLEPGGLDGVGRRNQAASDVPRGLRSYRTGSLKLDFPDMDVSIRYFTTSLRVCFHT